jgi:predicted Zn-dependent peptidase
LALPSVSVPFFVHVLPLDRNISGEKQKQNKQQKIPPPPTTTKQKQKQTNKQQQQNFEMGVWFHPLTRAHAYQLEVASIVSISPFSDYYG